MTAKPMTLNRLIKKLEERRDTLMTDIDDQRAEGSWYHNSYGAGYQLGRLAIVQSILEIARGGSEEEDENDD